LREKGKVALAHYLTHEVGARRRVLTESHALGRTEQFLAVRLATPVMPGEILDLKITDHDGLQLLAA
jgi:hypothetical protein